jgi:hypothetical protein
MTGPSWKASGQYYETCNCDFVCPCIPGQLAASPTRLPCLFAMAFQIDRGTFGTLTLDGLGFIVLGTTPEAMIKGNWSVGVIVDDRASAEQRDAIVAIASGSAGGPMAALSPLVGKFLGTESAPIRFERSGATWSVTAGSLVDMAAQGAMGINPNATEPLRMENTGHPAADSFSLARALRSHVDALGLSLHDTSGRTNGQYAPFSWRSA